MEPIGDQISRLHAWKVKNAGASEDMCFQLSIVELDSYDEEGVPLTSVVLRHLDGYTPAKFKKLGKNENAAITILSEHGGSMLVGDLRKAIREHIKSQATKRGKPEPKYDTLKKTSRRVLASLLDKSLVIESDDGKTVNLPNRGHGGHMGDMSPNVPRTHGGHGGHTPIGMS
ncbi:MAG TPA: hypothetical protein VJ508_04890, partial [Saprospiraceae bacterium]|nr:hypothetical protein [Saprospiraceae bacterium]